MSSPKTVALGALKIVGIGVAVVLVLAVAAFLWILYEVSVPDSGNRAADRDGEARAQLIAEDLEPRYAQPVDAENLAQRVLDEHAGGGVTVLSWDGDSGADGGAVVEVGIRVELAAVHGEWFDPGRTAGSSTTCWRLVVHAWQHDAQADRDEIRCPDDPGEGPIPDPTPLPSLGPDAEATVLRVLDALPAGATAASAEAALRAEFAEFVDVQVEEGYAELVAAVGVLRSRDCIIGIAPDDEPAWRFSDFRRIRLEPGEGGCTPRLYLAPVTTH